MAVYSSGALVQRPRALRRRRGVGAVVLLAAVLAQALWLVVLAWAVVELAVR
jgi:hypothetical protein